MATVKFKRGPLANLVDDPDALSVCNKVLSNSDEQYSEIYLGDDLVGVGHPFVPSAGLAGLVPAPTGTIGQDRFLREDASWEIPKPRVSPNTDSTDTYYPLILKHTASTQAEVQELQFSSSALDSTNHRHLAATATGKLYVTQLTTDSNVAVGGGLTVASDARFDTIVSVVENLNVGGEISGLLKYVANNESASSILRSAFPIASNSTQDTKPVTAKNVYDFVTGTLSNNQSDWEQDTTTAYDHILNRPNIRIGRNGSTQVQTAIVENDIEDNIASSGYSHAEGIATAATGLNSHSEGDSTAAAGESSHSEGYTTSANGFASHSEGESTWAVGYGSHSEGGSSLASGEFSHSEGDNTTASGDYSNSSGVGSYYNLLISSGPAGATEYTTSTTNHGIKVGSVVRYGYVFARVVYVSGQVFRTNVTLSPSESLNGKYIRRTTGVAYGVGSHVEGAENTASGTYSHAEGSGNIVTGDNSHAEGSGNIVTGDNSHAEGLSNKASGYQSHAEGATNRVSGDYSHAEGVNNIASGAYSHAEGSSNTASGAYSHAEGSSNTASGAYSHAEGATNRVSGDYSHVEGSSNTASGSYSHAEGYKTQSYYDFQHASGLINNIHTNSSTYNTIHPSGGNDYTLFCVGNGTETQSGNSLVLSRSNAFEVMRSGDTYIKGVASFDGNNVGRKKTVQYFLDIAPLTESEYDDIFDPIVPRGMTMDTLRSLHLFIDDYPDDNMEDILGNFGYSVGEEEEFVQDISQQCFDGYYLEEGSNLPGGYQYLQSMRLDDDVYHIFVSEAPFEGAYYGFMSDDITLQDLESYSMYTDYTNRWSPFAAFGRGEEIEDIQYSTTGDWGGSDEQQADMGDSYTLVCYSLDE